MVAAAPKASMILSCLPVGLMSGKAWNREGRLVSCLDPRLLRLDIVLRYEDESAPLAPRGRLSRLPRCMESEPSLRCTMSMVGSGQAGAAS